MNKKNDKYWEHRKAEMIHSQIARADVTFDEISKVYNHSRKHIEKSIKGIFNKFQAEYGLSKKEAEQVIKIMRAKNKKLIPALSLLPSTPKIKQTIEMLSSAAYVSRINRLQKLLGEIDNVQRYIARNELRKTTDLYKDVAKNAYYGSIHQIQTQTGIGFSFNELDEDLVEKLLAVPWNNKNYRDRVWDNATELSSALKNEVTQAVLTGKSEKLVIDEISNRFNVGEFKAKRLVRTETAYINNEMEALSYIEADIEKYRFVAVLDIRTSHICREHDYKVYDVSKRQVGVNFPPLHPFCRSTTIAVLDTENLSELSRRARDPKTGKNIIIPGNMSYNEWYKQYGKPKEIVVNTNEKVYNKDTDIKGAIHGAWNDENDPYQKKRDKHAAMFYEAVRKRDKVLEISVIAKNTGFSKTDIEKIYNHIFIAEHNLNGKLQRFAPDYNMSESWRRLREGKDIQEHDIILLKHELMELNLMRNEKLNYFDAHNITQEKYNYEEALVKWLKKGGT